METAHGKRPGAARMMAAMGQETVMVLEAVMAREVVMAPAAVMGGDGARREKCARTRR